MPKPKKNESKQDFLNRCTKELIENEDRSADQAYAMCNAFWDEKTGERSVLSLSAPLELKGEAADGEKKSFMITAYTGKTIKSWFGSLIFDVKGMAAKAKIPILREHQRDRVVGFSTKSWKDNNYFFISGDFSESTQDGREVLKLGEEGFPWQASVGIWPQRVEVLEKKGKAVVNGQAVDGPAEIWRESLVGEVSFVSLGADDDTAAIVLSDQGLKVPVSIYSVKQQSQEEKDMDLKTLQAEHPELFKEVRGMGLAEGFETGKAEGLKDGAEAERARIIEIREAAFDGQEALVDELIAEGTGVADAVKQLNRDQKARVQGELEKIEKSDTGDMGANLEDNDNLELDAGQTAKDRDEADKKLAAMAKDLKDKEGIPFSKAFERVCRENPALEKLYLGKD